MHKDLSDQSSRAWKLEAWVWLSWVGLLDWSLESLSQLRYSQLAKPLLRAVCRWTMVQPVTSVGVGWKLYG